MTVPATHPKVLTTFATTKTSSAAKKRSNHFLRDDQSRVALRFRPAHYSQRTFPSPRFGERGSRGEGRRVSIATNSMLLRILTTQIYLLITMPQHAAQSSCPKSNRAATQIAEQTASPTSQHSFPGSDWERTVFEAPPRSSTQALDHLRCSS